MSLRLDHVSVEVACDELEEMGDTQNKHVLVFSFFYHFEKNYGVGTTRAIDSTDVFVCSSPIKCPAMTISNYNKI